MMRRPYSATHEKPVISVTVGGTQGDIMVYLDNANPDIWKRFYCSVCGKVAFEYKDGLSIVMAGKSDETVKAPVRIQCKSCKAVYAVQN